MELRRPEVSGFLITSITGLGPPKANINYTELATNDGGIFNSALAQSRNIVIQMLYYGSEQIETLRQKSYKFFPIKKRVRLVFELDNRTAEISGYVESNEPNIFSKTEGTSISIICPDPNFYSTGESGTESTVFSGIVPLFEFPFSNESLTEDLIEFGEIQNRAEQTIYYAGDTEIGITILIHALGPVGDITIYNTGTREMLKLNVSRIHIGTASGLIAGDDVTINTVKGNKYVRLTRNGVTYNILNSLDRDSDWFQLAKGDNIFAYVCDYGATDLQFRIENNIVYEGL